MVDSNKPLTTIVGAGLCGLATAYRLQQAGIPVTVLEANAYAGGRIQPAADQDSHQDLGPTWVWPYAQPVVTQWLDELGLTLFDQFDSGDGLVDRSSNEPAIRHSLPAQYGSARIIGGTHALIQRLEKSLPGVVQFNQFVTDCVWDADQWTLNLSNASADQPQKSTRTDRLIIATPPRLAAAMFDSETDSLDTVLPILKQAETWMAPHAKVVAFYDTAFWRETGLSGRIASHVGPLAEVHDHSGPNGSPAALFGFAGIPAAHRLKAGEQLIDAIADQLQRCFGEKAPKPTRIVIKDWAFEPFITTQADRDGSGAHPPVLGPQVRQSHCNETLWFAGSETSALSAGLIEGALARADEIATHFKAME